MANLNTNKPYEGRINVGDRIVFIMPGYQYPMGGTVYSVSDTRVVLNELSGLGFPDTKLDIVRSHVILNKGAKSRRQGEANPVNVVIQQGEKQVHRLDGKYLRPRG